MFDAVEHLYRDLGLHQTPDGVGFAQLPKERRESQTGRLFVIDEVVREALRQFEPQGADTLEEQLWHLSDELDGVHLGLLKDRAQGRGLSLGIPPDWLVRWEEVRMDLLAGRYQQRVSELSGRELKGNEARARKLTRAAHQEPDAAATSIWGGLAHEFGHLHHGHLHKRRWPCRLMSFIAVAVVEVGAIQLCCRALKPFSRAAKLPPRAFTVAVGVVMAGLAHWFRVDVVSPWWYQRVHERQADAFAATDLRAARGNTWYFEQLSTITPYPKNSCCQGFVWLTATHPSHRERAAFFAQAVAEHEAGSQ